jgi:DNA repair protein RecO (recombination protein O)
MALKKDRAIVIRSFPLAEVDRIITFCTPQFGKVRAVASGSRRATSRLAASVELFNIGELVYWEKPNRDLHRVNSFDVTNAIGTDLRDPLCLAYASYLAELCAEFGLENDRDPALFGLLEAALDAVLRTTTVGELRRLARAFEMKLLILGGHRPRLDACVVCDEPIASEKVSIGVRLGGALCHRHSGRDRSLVVGRGALEAAAQLASARVHAAGTFDLDARSGLQLRRLMSLLLSEHLERRMRCADYIDLLEKSAEDTSPVAN